MNDLVGKKVVLIFNSTDTNVYTIVNNPLSESGEYEGVRYSPIRTWTYFSSSGLNKSFRIATDEEIEHEGRFDGSCPHQFITYDRLVIQKRIPLKLQKYSDANSWAVECCEWCGLEKNAVTILKKPYRW